MRTSISGLLAVSLLVLGTASHADTAWSTQDYDLHPGDFNGDGLTDVLYIARDPAHLSGIALSDGSGFNTPLQSWGNAYLGIPWSDGLYTILVADFNGDGKDDLFLQRNAPGDHYLLLTEEGGVGAISETLPNDAAGLDWSAHRLVAGDFNGDGHADLFLQASEGDGLNAVVTADAEGLITASAPDQSWEDGYGGFDWAASEALVFAGDFNGDGQDDLLLQARPIPGTGTDALNPAVYVPNMNGVVLAQPGKALFVTEAVQAWSRDGFKAEWSPLISALNVADFNGDGRADALLQGQKEGDASYLLYGKAKGAIFESAQTLEAGQLPAAESYLLLPGAYSGKAASLYAQARLPTGSNSLATLSGTSTLKVITTLADAALAFDAGSTAGGDALSLAAPESGGTGPLALVTPNAPGRTPGQFAVSPMGAATYQIPIWTPPGARGLEPKLALVYASGSPDGVMGPGWNLAGLSAIARCNKTYADNNGAPAPVTLTMTDDFCIDGSRMRVTSGTYGAANSVYQTMIANFSRITAYSAAGNGPSYFYVEGKDGLIYEYGNTTDSKAYANGGSTPYAWMLNKVRDRQGNNLKVVYSTTSGAVQPSSIQYTQTPSTNGSTYPYTVAFTYQNRVTNLSKYVAGGSIQETKVLSKINVQSSGTSVRQYNLTYATAPATQRDRLASIQECAGSAGTECLKATTVSYQDGTAGIAAPATSTGSGATVAGTLKTADIDGDGRDDLLFATQSGSNYLWWVQFATTSGFGSPVNTGASTTSTSNVLLDDFLGEGRNSVLAANGSTWYQYRWNGSAFAATATGVTVESNLSADQATTADTDGDGLADLVTMPGASGTFVYVRRNTSVNGTISFASTTTSTYVLNGVTPRIRGNNGYPNSAIRHMDFDGDGRDDIVIYVVVLHTNGVVPYLARGGTFVRSSEWSFYYPPNTLASSIPAKWNDDACTDMMTMSDVRIAPCAGGAVTMFIYSSTSATSIAAVDWDGDGRTDAIANMSGTWMMYRSLATAAATGVSTGIAASSGQWITLDRDGDGESDLAFSDASASNAIKTGVHNGTNTPPDLATSITDGWGVAAYPTYLPLTQGGSLYTKYSTAVFPESDFQGAAYVVSQAAQSDGLGGSFSNTFQYTGARIHRQGRGFEGFAKTRSVDLRNNLVHEVLYNQSFPYTGTVDQDTVYRSDGTTVITRTDSDYLVKTLNDPSDTTGSKCLQTPPLALDTRCFPYLQKSTADSYELTGATPLWIQRAETTYVVDDYGNPTTVTTTTTDKDSTTPSPFYNSVWTSVVANTITNNTTNWCLGKPTRTTTTNTVPGQPVLTRTADHTIDYVNCRFGTETIEPTVSLLTVVTTFGYDTCGNVNLVSIVGKDRTGTAMPVRATTSSFGTRCAFPESVTNALSQTATTAYNYSYGVKSSTTDPNAISVSWGYDSFGRRTSETRPDGTSSTWLYEDCTTVSCWGGTIVDNLRLRVTETLYSSAYGVVRTRIKSFDALERQRYESGERVLGVMTTSKVVLDNQGRKLDVYQPYASPHNGYHRYTYDDLNRPTADTLYNSSSTLDRQTLMAYSGLKTTLTDARGNVTQKWTDVTGKLRRIIDPAPGGTTSYEFDAFGNLVQMKDASLAQTDYTYNLRGFKTASSDPDTGSWSYAPNSLNELEQQTDAIPQVTSFGYDKLGRMTSRTEPETPGTPTTWTYGTSAALHNIGRLQSVSKPGGYAESYTFDSLGRPATSTYTVDGTAYAIDSAYNTLGAVDTVTYPTSSSGYRFTLKYVYSYGFVQQVKDNAAGTIFWSLSAANDYASPTTEVLGNAATITSGYTPWTNDLTSRQVTKGSTLQNLAYQWDLNGNLAQRQDQVQNLIEVFSNDTLNRLTGGTLNTVSNLSVGYAANGNITSKSDAGSFDYTTQQAGCSYAGLTAQPHAVRKAGSTVFCYDKNGNMISRGGSTISWYSYNQPDQINSGTNSTQFEYTGNHQRWKQTAVDGTGTTTTWYIGGLMEKLQRPGSVIEYRHMIPAGSGTAIYMRKPDGSNATTYLTTDHLGSGDLILDSAGTVLAKTSFTPFGARRGSNWQGLPTSANYTTFADKTRRGFTGHEMLDAVGLVNMNGRVYDPLIGRFLSADPIIQTINLSQALNPYSYVMNMPLTLIDPSGYSWLSKLFSNIGKFFKKFWRPLLAIAIAVFAPQFLALYMNEFAAAVVAGMMAGAVATGTLQGALLGGALAGAFYGLGKLGEGIYNAARRVEDSQVLFAANGAGPGMMRAMTGGVGAIDEVVITAPRYSWISSMLIITRRYASVLSTVGTWAVVADGSVMAQGYVVEPSSISRPDQLLDDRLYDLGTNPDSRFGPDTLTVESPFSETGDYLMADNVPVEIHPGNIGTQSNACPLPSDAMASASRTAGPVSLRGGTILTRGSRDAVQLIQEVMKRSQHRYLLVVNPSGGIPTIPVAH